MALSHPMIRRGRGPSRGRGFTLIEAAFVIVISGFAVVAMLQLITVGSFTNKESTELTTAINLADNLHEATMALTFDEAVALNNRVYSPPVDSRLNAIAELGTPWSQTVSVQYVNPNNLTTVSTTGVQPTARVTATIKRSNVHIYSTSWIICK